MTILLFSPQPSLSVVSHPIPSICDKYLHYFMHMSLIVQHWCRMLCWLDISVETKSLLLKRKKIKYQRDSDDAREQLGNAIKSKSYCCRAAFSISFSLSPPSSSHPHDLCWSPAIRTHTVDVSSALLCCRDKSKDSAAQNYTAFNINPDFSEKQ